MCIIVCIYIYIYIAYTQTPHIYIYIYIHNIYAPCSIRKVLSTSETLRWGWPHLLKLPPDPWASGHPHLTGLRWVIPTAIPGWWLSHPSEKYESQLVWWLPNWIEHVPNHQPDTVRSAGEVVQYISYDACKECLAGDPNDNWIVHEYMTML